MRVEGQTVILRNEEIYNNNTSEMLVIRESGRYIIRAPSRDMLTQHLAE